MNAARRRRVAVAVLALVVAGCGGHRGPALAPAAVADGRAARSLQHDIDAVLASPALAHGYWGVLVRSLGTGQTLYALNGARLMMPASTLKIVTLAAAAERLGWDFTYVTRATAAGSIDGDALAGDVVVRGSGDPSLTETNSGAVFDDWAGWLDRLGIRKIRGRIIGDDCAFDRDERLGMGWSWDDLAEGYSAGVSGLQYNENAASLTIAPGSVVGAPASLTVAPAAAGLRLNRVAVLTSAAGSAPHVVIRRFPESEDLDVSGSIPLGAMPRMLTVSVEQPALFFARTLRDALIARGIDVQGPAAGIRESGPLEAEMQDRQTLLAEHRSPPLSTLAATLMKRSQNLYAETFLMTLGAIERQPDADVPVKPDPAFGRTECDTVRPSSIDRGREVVRDVLVRWGISADGLVQRDGSGLSRYDYVTPETLVAILTHVDRDERLRGPFEAALPVAGRDGTLTNRMKGTPAEARVVAKTGSMSNVRAWAGFVNAADERLVFAILANNFEAPPETITAAAEAILVRLASFRR
ncbi:MAG TPA: D-alanyl-D-alanine carboxypeptidase/D-alanyl-D-alanine-endopeptidase [Vicinamibacterales bacterium]|nr:D-alanyl-D-alanine carboxypeptidase/D-alanyl-D-alanine-endopeptidase [Vicinamibacterales bacterium]